MLFKGDNLHYEEQGRETSSETNTIQPRTIQCRSCGYNDDINKCPTYGKICAFCKKKKEKKKSLPETMLNKKA